MSEVNLSALAEAGNDQLEAKAPTPMQEVNSALKVCGLGLFHVQLLIACCVVYISSVVISNTASFLLPSAECDLHMNLVQKGLLNAMPYIGMICSSVIAGFLTDTFGRKVFIQGGLAGTFFFMMISGSSQTFEVLITSKFFEGLLFACYFNATITLTAEFCHDGIRDRVLILQSSYMAIAQILVPAISWSILPYEWNLVLFEGKFVLHTWNFYLYLMSLWPLVGFILYIFIPESPKYLVTQKKYKEAKDVLLKIYRMNTWKSVDTFEYKDLFKKEMDQASKKGEENEKRPEETVAHQIVVALHNIKPMFQRPIVIFMVLVCIINYTVMSVYNVFRLWYPQLSTIVEYGSFTSPDGESQDLCMLLDTYTSHLKETRQASNGTEVCVTRKSGAETYINNIIVGCACTVPYFVTGMLVARIGKKPLQLAGVLIACATTLGLRWADSKTTVVALFALTIAITQNLMSLNQVCTLEYLPTNMRSLGISLMMMMGRIGTLSGNILFPVMLEMGCSIPFFTLGGMLTCVVLMIFILPTKKK